MIELTVTEIDELLTRHGIPQVADDDASLADSGGVVANISIRRTGDESYMTVMINELSSIDLRPVDEERALALVRRFRGHGLPAGETRLEHMFAHLLLKLSELYDESKALTLRCDLVHLHPTSYRIGKVRLQLAAPLELKDRLSPHEHDRHAVFSHRHGSRSTFPR